MLSDRELNHIVRIGQLSQECMGEVQFADIMTNELVSMFDLCSSVFLEFGYAETYQLVSSTSYGIENSHGLAYMKHYHHLLVLRDDNSAVNF